AGRERVGVGVVDRALEQRDVCARGRVPDRREGVARAGEEVGRGGLHAVVGHGDQNGSGDQREHDREHGDEAVSGRDRAKCLVPARWLVLGGAHSATSDAVSSIMPAIIRPRVSRGVSPGTMPTTFPRYITMIRSARAVASSSSVEITMTGIPLSRVATMRVWMNPQDPTS